MSSVGRASWGSARGTAMALLVERSAGPSTSPTRTGTRRPGWIGCDGSSSRRAPRTGAWRGGWGRSWGAMMSSTARGVPGSPSPPPWAAGRIGPRVFVFVHNLDRPRGRVAARVVRLGGGAAALAACCWWQYDFLRNYLGVPESKLHLLLEHVNNRFFSPGPPSPDKTRPLIVGVGLERRDYRTPGPGDRRPRCERPDQRILLLRRPQRTVAPATRCRPTCRADSIPGPTWCSLYRDADVVVVPVFPSRYAAGVNDAPRRRGVPAARRGDPIAGPLRLPLPGERRERRRAVQPRGPPQGHPRPAGAPGRGRGTRRGCGHRRIAESHDFDRSFEGLARLMESL